MFSCMETVMHAHFAYLVAGERLLRVELADAVPLDAAREAFGDAGGCLFGWVQNVFPSPPLSFPSAHFLGKRLRSVII